MQRENKRKFSRILMDSDVSVSSDTDDWKSELVDISLNGALIVKPDDWYESRNNNFELDIRLDGDSVRIHMLGEIAHEEDDYIGFHCKQIDLESMSRLRQMIALNIGDESLLERELSALAA